MAASKLPLCPANRSYAPHATRLGRALSKQEMHVIKTAARHGVDVYTEAQLALQRAHKGVLVEQGRARGEDTWQRMAARSQEAVRSPPPAHVALARTAAACQGELMQLQRTFLRQHARVSEAVLAEPLQPTPLVAAVAGT